MGAGRHVLPNATSVILVQATVAIPAAILGEAVLSFLGLGIQPPAPSLGTMLATAQQFAARAPWAAILPGSRSCCSPWRSTCSATACATPSTRRRADE